MSPFGLLVGLIPAVILPWALLRKLERKDEVGSRAGVSVGW
jgi:hypothetical protein